MSYTNTVQYKPIGFFWTITDPGTGMEVPLLGSLHSTTKKMANFPKAILDRFNNCSGVAIEITPACNPSIDMEGWSWKNVQTRILNKFSLEEKRDLYSYLLGQEPPDIDEPRLTESLVAFLEEYQTNAHTLSRIRNMLFRRDYENRKDTGYEEVFCAMAKKRNVPVKPLETADDHLRLSPCESAISDIPIAKYRDLKEALKDYRQPWGVCKSVGNLSTHPEKYTFMENGDLEGLEAHYASIYPWDQELIIERNINIARAIHAMILKGEKNFNLVGVDHMAGPKGIPTLLAEMGYKVERHIIREPV